MKKSENYNNDTDLPGINENHNSNDPRIFNFNSSTIQHLSILKEENNNRRSTDYKNNDKVDNNKEQINSSFSINDDRLVDNLLIKSSINSNIIIGKHYIYSSIPIMFDLKNKLMKLNTITFNENRVLNKDGTSEIQGFYVNDYESNKVLLKTKQIINEIACNNFNLYNIEIYGDNLSVTFEDGVLDEKEITLKIRGLSKVFLGDSKVKKLQIDNMLATIDKSKISIC